MSRNKINHYKAAHLLVVAAITGVTIASGGCSEKNEHGVCLDYEVRTCWEAEDKQCGLTSDAIESLNRKAYGGAYEISYPQFIPDKKCDELGFTTECDKCYSFKARYGTRLLLADIYSVPLCYVRPKPDTSGVKADYLIKTWSFNAKASSKYNSNTLQIENVRRNYLGQILFTGVYQGKIQIGKTVLYEENSYSGFIAKIDEKGSPVWSLEAKYYGSIDIRGEKTNRSIDVEDMEVDNEGNIYLLGAFYNQLIIGNKQVSYSKTNSKGEYTRGVFIAKLSSDGNLEWIKNTEESGTGQDDSMKIMELEIDKKSQEIILLGCVSGQVDFAGVKVASENDLRKCALSDCDLFTMRLDSKGKMISSIVYGKELGAQDQGSVSYSVMKTFDNGDILFTGEKGFQKCEINSENRSERSKYKLVTRADVKGVVKWSMPVEPSYYLLIETGSEEATYLLYIISGPGSVGGVKLEPCSGESVQTYLTSMSYLLTSTSYLIKLEKNGKILWSRKSGGTYGIVSRMKLIRENGKDRIYLSGKVEWELDVLGFRLKAKNGYTCKDHWSYDSFIARVNGNGVLEWAVVSPVRGFLEEVGPSGEIILLYWKLEQDIYTPIIVDEYTIHKIKDISK